MGAAKCNYQEAAHLGGAGESHEDVGGNVHVDGARAAGDGSLDGSGDEGRDVADTARSASVFGEALHRRHLVQLLERPLAHLTLRNPIQLFTKRVVSYVKLSNSLREADQMPQPCPPAPTNG